uniref:Uncharacterized protein n=1 Tax=Cuerna arida TaxID=1464854 RepID=A0A1B6GJJ7_9HEMI
MPKTRNGKIATGLAAAAFFFVFIAFVTPSWLVSDGYLPNPKMEQIGLWCVCFHDFEDTRHWYETKFTGCWWVFEEEYYIIHDVLLPGFFLATQFFFTVCFTTLLAVSFGIAMYLFCSRDQERYVLLLIVIGTALMVAALSGTIALFIFGANGDGRVWMPNWEHNNLGYSYAMAVIGVICSYVSGALFLVEGRRHHAKRQKLNERHMTGSGGYPMQPTKSSHTTI